MIDDETCNWALRVILMGKASQGNKTTVTEATYSTTKGACTVMITESEPQKSVFHSQKECEETECLLKTKNESAEKISVIHK